MRRLFRFWLNAHALPIEMGRRLRMAGIARVCPLCLGVHMHLWVMRGTMFLSALLLMTFIVAASILLI